MSSVEKIDALIECSVSALANDPHVKQWHAKEHDWVSYFAFRHVIQHCRPDGAISHPAQLGIEVGVPQPSSYKARATRRDLVIWPAVGMTCWAAKYEATHHPLAVVEWKVHRPLKRNRHVAQEREWLRSYCRTNKTVLGYAIEVDGFRNPMTITCSRFLNSDEKSGWLRFEL